MAMTPNKCEILQFTQFLSLHLCLTNHSVIPVYILRDYSSLTIKAVTIMSFELG